MIREIKFRGKDINTGEWRYGDLEIGRKTKIIRIHTYDEDGEYCQQYIVDGSTVGQFAGLKDKNGKEIYEGDVVRYIRYNIHSEYFNKEISSHDYLIYWNESQHAFWMCTKFLSGGGASGNLNFVDERAESNEIEVIGNIYDNLDFRKKWKE